MRCDLLYGILLVSDLHCAYISMLVIFFLRPDALHCFFSLSQTLPAIGYFIYTLKVNFKLFVR